MNRSDFIRMVASPEKIGGKDTELLRQLIQEFPYFQTAQLLYTKGLRNTNSVHYNSRLKIAAIYSTDRHLLYRLMSKKEQTQKAPVVSPIAKTPVTTPSKKETVATNISTTDKQPAKPVEPKKDSDISTSKVQQKPVSKAPYSAPVLKKETSISKKENTETITPKTVSPTPKPEIPSKQVPPAPTPKKDIPDVIKKPAKLPDKKETTETKERITPSVSKVTKEKLPQTPIPKDTLLEKEILENAINSSIEREVTRTSIDDESKSTGSKKEITENAAQVIGDTKPVIEQDRQIPEKTKESEQEPPVNIEQKPFKPNDGETHGFGDWLKLINHKEEAASAKQDGSGSLSVNELIDKFIEEEPKISKPKAEFFSPVNIARKSVTEDDTLVSETLAQIYEAQGNYSKALKCYESLSLKYPKKSVYFAGRIKEIEKIIHQQK